MERYLVELDGDQIELLMGMVREAKKIADENKIPELEGFSPEMTDDGMVRHPSFKRLVP
jgi:hypothetical protein